MRQPSGSWVLDFNNAAQMARVFVESEQLLANHPMQALGALGNRDLESAEYLYNEAAAAAWAALQTPSVFRDESASKRMKKMRDPRDGDSWGTILGIGDTDSTLKIIYEDAALAHAVLVIDNFSAFPSAFDLDERVARHYRDALLGVAEPRPAGEGDFIHFLRHMRSEGSARKPSMNFGEARNLAVANGVSGKLYLRAHQIGSKRIPRDQWKSLQIEALRQLTDRMFKLGTRLQLQYLLAEIATPGSTSG